MFGGRGRGLAHGIPLIISFSVGIPNILYIPKMVLYPTSVTGVGRRVLHLDVVLLEGIGYSGGESPRLVDVSHLGRPFPLIPISLP